ncbi:outer membrane beta-barrel protein [Phyllobacterium sp. SYP-B3895]|uniref:outer membrane protein n=1 Tax=Phyllobacterium sp. SYP-B3895 TaxID=2663240 RepID=UPI0012997183|nr:outer membrane protein [Phyllobacterium sp. SYP-B3895]MRG55080.1 outer membrane beta-barrel protein [Phyllobacterium sp. SYP-B3895]
MSTFNKFAAMGAAIMSLGAAPALAADMIQDPVVEVAPFGGWYLRGDIGMSNQQFDHLDYVGFADPAYHTFFNDGDFDAGMTAQIGVGYQFNDWLRADVTGQYRGKTDFSALDFYDIDGDLTTTDDAATNEYHAKKSEWLFLANAYADLGTYAGITPYVGAGIGASRNTISGFTDNNIITGGGGYAGSASQWELAWALHAGVGIKATDRMTIDIGYSYVDLGDGKTDNAFNYINSLTRENPEPFKFKDITSHDFKVGVRYAF